MNEQRAWTKYFTCSLFRLWRSVIRRYVVRLNRTTTNTISVPIVSSSVESEFSQTRYGKSKFDGGLF